MTGADSATEVTVLGGVGTGLIFVNAIVDLLLGSIPSAPLQFSADALALGAAGVIVSILLTAFLFLYSDSVDTDAQSLWGMLLALMGAFSLWLGGGFLIGFVLVFAAGVLAVILARVSEATLAYRLPISEERMASLVSEFRSAGAPYSKEGSSSGGTGSGASWSLLATPDGGPGEGPKGWVCSHCYRQNRSDDSFCRQCGVARGTT